MFKKYRQRRKAKKAIKRCVGIATEIIAQSIQISKRTNESMIKIKDSELKKFIKESLNVTDLKIINPRWLNSVDGPHSFTSSFQFNKGENKEK